MARLIRDWRALDSEQHLALGAAAALFITMLLPWYQQNGFVNIKKEARVESHNLTAFQVFTFVEAAVLLVALAIGYLLYARAEGRDFNLPGGDGAVVLAAGLWTVLLLIYRLFDKPGISRQGVAANVGVQWGIFFALAAAGLLAYAGSRMRHAERTEVHPGAGPRMEPRERRRAAERHDPGPPPGPPDHEQELTAAQPAGAPARGSGTGAAGETPARPERPRYPPAPPSRQMSFDDSPSEPD
jgi:hypothetical protein